MLKARLPGFTLAELLIALAILGEVATFTIPKIINAQQNGAKKAATKEVFSTIAAAYQTYRLNNTVSSSTSIRDITQYLNYVSLDSTSKLDGSPNDSAYYDCSQSSRNCMKLQNGGTLLFGLSGSFGGTNTTNMQWFLFDPDGTYTGDASSIWGALYYNGRVTSWANIAPNSSDGVNLFNPGNNDPSWFSW